MRAALVYNPAAGRRHRHAGVSELAEALREGGYEAEILSTRGPGDATTLARQGAAEGRWQALFVLGGDGTVREAAAGLMGSELALGILPGGTTNVLAMALGLPSKPLPAARAVSQLAPHPFDVGLCGSQPFLMMASAGLDAAALARTSSRLKNRLGKFGVALPGLLAWWSYPYPWLELEADGEALTASFAAVCNISLYAGSFRLAPGARFDDRRLDLVTFHQRGRAATLSFAASLARGTHVDRRDVQVRRVEEVVFHGAEGAPFQLDGDPCSDRPPLRVALSDQTLRMLTPR